MHLKRNNPYINKWNHVMASSLRCNHDISFIPAQSGFLGLVYYITDYATKIAKPIYHYFSIAAALLSSGPSRANEEAENEETDSFKSRLFLTRIYNKAITSREISGPEVANVMLGQPESYSNAKFTTLNYDSLYSEMLMMFPYLKAKKLVEESMTEPIVNIVGRDMVKDQFSDYRHRGDTLKSLCLYDYKCTVFTKKASDIQNKRADEDSDGYAHFSKSHPLHS